jgi:hypothetical protein
MTTKVKQWLKNHIQKQNKCTKGTKLEWKIFQVEDQSDWNGTLYNNKDVVDELINKKECYVECYISTRQMGDYCFWESTDCEMFNINKI